jgi:hypothetical protein
VVPRYRGAANATDPNGDVGVIPALLIIPFPTVKIVVASLSSTTRLISYLPFLLILSTPIDQVIS